MARKRKERHSQWKNQVEELRAAEFKPFITASEVVLGTLVCPIAPFNSMIHNAVRLGFTVLFRDLRL